MDDDDGIPEAAAPAYYYERNPGATAGPCTVPQLAVLWRSGIVAPETPLWREGMPSWERLDACAEVADVVLTLPRPPAPTEHAGQWYYLHSDGERRGGVTAEQLGALLRAGEVDGMTLVWQKEMPAWVELGQCEPLRERLLTSDAAEMSGDEEADPARQTFDPDALAAEPTPRAAARPAVPPAAAGGGGVDASGAPVAAGGATKRKRARKKKKFVADGGSSVYVSALPADVTEQELAECFRVAGVLKGDASDGSARLKIYRTADGAPKGDALVTYLKSESVALAVTLRDGYELRPGVRINVQPAKFEMRGDALVQKGLDKEAAAARKKQKLVEERRLAGWDDAMAAGKGAAATMVILKGLFSAAEVRSLDDAPDFYANLKQDVEVECRKAGALDKVIVFEGSEVGAVAVKFKQVDEAQRCVAMMNERRFGGSEVVCEPYDGVSDYRAREVRDGAPAAAAGCVTESAQEQEENLESFAQWLEEADSTDDEAEEGGD